MYKLYILLCSDNSLYTGITKNIKKRMMQHKIGDGSKYVRSRLPFKLIYIEECGDRSEALKREYEVKSWIRDEKIKNLGLKFENNLLPQFFEDPLF
jgi:putative endonuclease